MISNCNPLNIRYRSEGYWQGQAPSGGRAQFCRFYDMKWGFRAAFRLMQTYYERYHLDTVEKIVSRWAPPKENDTKAYVSYVVNDLAKRGFRPQLRPPLRHQCSLRPPLPPPTQEGKLECMTLPHPSEDSRLWIALALAMARMECGPKCITLAIEQAAAEGYRLLFQW